VSIFHSILVIFGFFVDFFIFHQTYVMDSMSQRHIVPPGGESGGTLDVGIHAVVAVPQRDDVEVARVRSGHQHGQIICLRPAVHKIDDLRVGRERFVIIILMDEYGANNTLISLTHFEIPRQLGGQRRRVLVQLGVHVNVCRVPQPLHLLDRRLVHLPAIRVRWQIW